MAPPTVTLTTLRGDVREQMEVSANEVRFTSDDAREPSLPAVAIAWTGAFLTPALESGLAGVPAGDHAENPRYRHALAIAAPWAPRKATWDSGTEGPDVRARRETLQRIGGLRANEARRELAAAKKAGEDGDVDAALVHAKRGLRVLGNMYWEPDTRDESGVRLEGGRAHELDGRHAEALAVFTRVLDARLHLFDDRTRG